MTLKGIHIFRQDRHSNEKTFIPWSDHNKPSSSFLKRLRDTQGTPFKEFLETLVDRNLDENFRPKTPCKCPKVTKMSDREVIMDAKQRKTENKQKPRPDLQHRILSLQTGVMMRMRMTKMTKLEHP